ncbi:MAG: double zinc ribbon domain-containing protein [Candidatus Xenobia bacterium]
MVCTGCGRTLADPAAFCPSCGKQFTRDDNQTQVVKTTPSNDNQPIRYAPHIGGTERRPRVLMLRCSECQYAIREETTVCPRCGRLLPTMSGSIYQKYRLAYLPRNSKDFSLYVLASVGPPVRFLSSAPMKNLGIAVDITPSHDDRRKLAAIQQSLEYAIDQMEAHDNLTIGFFSSRAYLLMASERIDDKRTAKRLVAKKLEGMNLGDGRNLLEGLDAVGREIQKNMGKDRLNQIVVMTDGTCPDEQQCVRRARELNELGINVTVLGLGDRINLNFLSQLAQVGGGKCYHRIDISHIPEIFTQELRSVKAVYATNVELFLRMTGDFKPVRAYRVGPFISDLGRVPDDTVEISLPLADLQLYDSQDILLEMVPRTSKIQRHELLSCVVKCDFPSEEVLNWSFTENVSLPTGNFQSFVRLNDPSVLSHVRLVSIFGERGLGVG